MLPLPLPDSLSLQASLMDHGCLLGSSKFIDLVKQTASYCDEVVVVPAPALVSTLLNLRIPPMPPRMFPQARGKCY